MDWGDILTTAGAVSNLLRQKDPKTGNTKMRDIAEEMKGHLEEADPLVDALVERMIRSKSQIAKAMGEAYRDLLRDEVLPDYAKQFVLAAFAPGYLAEVRKNLRNK